MTKKIDNKNATDALNSSDASNVDTASKDAGQTQETPKKIKLNSDAYAAWKKDFKFKPRVETEEREDKGRLTHKERGTRESDGYYNSRRIAFDVTTALGKQGKEFDTPQKNADLILETLNAKLPKEKKITRFVYVAKTFQLRFYPSDLPKDEFIAIDVSRRPNVTETLKSFGL